MPTNTDGDYGIGIGNLISDEDIDDDLGVSSTNEKNDDEEDFVEDEYVGMVDDLGNYDLGNTSYIGEEEDNLEDVLNFQNYEDDEGDAETALNSDYEDEHE